MNVMCPTHPDWEAFCDALAGEEYCNIKKGSVVMRCQPDHGYTRSLLAKRWPEIDVDATLELFWNHAGCCDCEVLLNVADSWENLHG
jgi:hypothetical protein